MISGAPGHIRLRTDRDLYWLAMYFFELHEGDDDLFHDILLVREEEIDPEEFFELVQVIRRRVQDDFVDDTLVEAIAAVLQREHGFIALTDDRLTAAVNVSMVEAENFLADLDAEDEDVDAGREDEEDEEDDEDGSADYLSILADYQSRRRRPQLIPGRMGDRPATERRPAGTCQRLKRISMTSPSFTTIGPTLRAQAAVLARLGRRTRARSGPRRRRPRRG